MTNVWGLEVFFLCNIAYFHFNFNILQSTIITLKPRLGFLCYYEEINHCIVRWCKLILISIWSSHGIQYKKCSETVKHPANAFSCSKLNRNVEANLTLGLRWFSIVCNITVLQQLLKIFWVLVTQVEVTVTWMVSM